LTVRNLKKILITFRNLVGSLIQNHYPVAPMGARGKNPRKNHQT
jgi:hypothetical protein